MASVGINDEDGAVFAGDLDRLCGGAIIDLPLKPVGEWNEVVVVADGPRITYSINGEVTTEMTDNSPKACKDGVIGFQMHGGHTMTLQFKDVKIKMLEKK